VLVSQAVFLFERGQTDATERPIHACGYVTGVGNDSLNAKWHGIAQLIDYSEVCLLFSGGGG